MTAVCPSITATDPHTYRQQVERVALFVERIHLDFMDGVLAKVKSPPVEHAWWPIGVQADIHMMYQQPARHLEQVIELKPDLIILHAEADGNFIEMSEKVRTAKVKLGLALLPGTSVETIVSALPYVDHILIFSGHLGHFGGRADLRLLDKVKELKRLKPALEIGWDGGVNDINIKRLVVSGVDVLNVGGFVQRAENPASAYAKLKALVS